MAINDELYSLWQLSKALGNELVCLLEDRLLKIGLVQMEVEEKKEGKYRKIHIPHDTFYL